MLFIPQSKTRRLKEKEVPKSSPTTENRGSGREIERERWIEGYRRRKSDRLILATHEYFGSRQLFRANIFARTAKRVSDQ